MNTCNSPWKKPNVIRFDKPSIVETGTDASMSFAAISRAILLDVAVLVPGDLPSLKNERETMNS